MRMRSSGLTRPSKCLNGWMGGDGVGRSVGRAILVSRRHAPYSTIRNTNRKKQSAPVGLVLHRHALAGPEARDEGGEPLLEEGDGLFLLVLIDGLMECEGEEGIEKGKSI